MRQLSSCRQIACFLAAILVFLTSCKPKETQTAQDAAQVLGIVLAEEALRAAGPKKEVALITADAVWGPSSPVEVAFIAALKKQGGSIVTTRRANVGDPMRSGPIGLKAADFLEVLDQFSKVGAVVSLAGAPLLNAGESNRVMQDHPPVLVVATAMLGMTPGVPGDRTQLGRLLDAKIIHLAIIDGTEPAGSTAGKADSAHQLFAEHYRILRRPD